MNILFISSRNTKNGISPIIKNQGESLKTQNVKIDYFTIEGKGISGYFKSILTLKKHLKKQKYDIFHAHYSLSGFAATLSGCRPLIVSLMGSDVKAKWYLKYCRIDKLDKEIEKTKFRDTSRCIMFIITWD